MQDLIKKADVMLEALPYVQRFRSSTFVVKYGGSFMDSPDPKVRTGVAADVHHRYSSAPGSRFVHDAHLRFDGEVRRVE